MDFKNYLDDNQIDIKDAAEALGVSQPCVLYWARGDKIPRPDKMVKIYLWSHGHVMPNDFYQLPYLLMNGNIAHLQRDLFCAGVSP